MIPSPVIVASIGEIIPKHKPDAVTTFTFTTCVMQVSLQLLLKQSRNLFDRYILVDESASNARAYQSISGCPTASLQWSVNHDWTLTLCPDNDRINHRAAKLVHGLEL